MSLRTRSRRPPVHSEKIIVSAAPQGKILILLCLAVIAIAIGFSAWFWQQNSRPGMNDYQQGLADATAHHYAEAKADWVRGTQEDPGFAPNWVQLGDLYAQGQDYKIAAQNYDTASGLLPNDSTVFLKLAQAQKENGDLAAATAAAQRATVLLPNDADALALYGSLENRQYNFPLALGALKRAHALKPQDREITLMLVYADGNHLDFANAESDLMPYLQAHPQDPEACYLGALIAVQRPPTPENLRTGLEYAQRAYAGLPNDVRVLNILGRLSLYADQPRQALQSYLAGQKLAPQSHAILEGLVTCYTRLGQPKEAAKAAAELPKASPGHDPAYPHVPY